jgi:6-phosphogluconolactonase (cycloisomerase 2 family)
MSTERAYARSPHQEKTMQLSSRMLARLAVGPLALAAAGALGTATASASPGPSRVVGHVYVNDNTAGTNTVAGFDRHADGALTPIPGSPFTAGGAGTGAGLASQGSVQLSSDGRWAIAVDAGSGQISVLRVHPDGRLTAVSSGPVASGGSDPVSVAAHDGLVYVANASATAPNYSGFRLTSKGVLKPLAGSTVTLPDGSQPGDVLFNDTGSRLVGTRVGSSEIDSFAVDANGLLTQPAGSPFAAQGVGPFGSVFSPTKPSQLFVTNAHNAPGDSTVSTFIDAADGTLTPQASSPVANGQSGSCWAAITPNGKTLFSVNTGSGTVTSYSVGNGGALKVIQSVPIRDGAGAGNSVDATVSPDGQDLYVLESLTGGVAEFDIAGGQLRELASDPAALPAGATAAGIAIN